MSDAFLKLVTYIQENGHAPETPEKIEEITGEPTYKIVTNP